MAVAEHMENLSQANENLEKALSIAISFMTEDMRKAYLESKEKRQLEKAMEKEKAEAIGELS